MNILISRIRFWTKLTVICLVAALLSSCYTYKPIATGSGEPAANSGLLSEKLKPGNRYRVFFTDGSKLKIDLKSPSQENIIAEVTSDNGGRAIKIIKYQEIARIEEGKLSGGKSLLLTVGILTPIIIIIIAYGQGGFGLK